MHAIAIETSVEYTSAQHRSAPLDVQITACWACSAPMMISVSISAPHLWKRLRPSALHARYPILHRS